MLPDPFIEFYDQLAWYLQLPIFLAVNVVILRGLIGNGILDEIKEHRLWHYLVRHWTAYWNEPRNAAIRDHFLENHSMDLEHCSFGMCNSL